MPILEKILTKANNVFYRRKKEYEYFKRIPFPENLGFAGFALVNLLTYLPFPRRRKPRPLSYYGLRGLLDFSREIREMRGYGKSLKLFIDSFYFKSVRAWEYGCLLSQVALDETTKILDIGPGCSPFPFFLALKGAEVTTVDIPTPTEPHFQPAGKETVNEVTGTMLKLPFGDNSFDLVSCISSIEHLDADYPENLPVPYELFIKRSKRALREMIRVCKPGGQIFLTTDYYLPSQTTDRWTTEWDIGIPYRRIGGAYTYSSLAELIRGSFGKKFVLKKRIGPFGANYRGRYFTTVAVLAKNWKKI